MQNDFACKLLQSKLLKPEQIAENLEMPLLKVLEIKSRLSL